MSVTKKSKGFSSTLNTILNSFEGAKIKSKNGGAKRGTIIINRIKADLVTKEDSQELHINVVYRYSYNPIKGEYSVDNIDDLLDEFIENIVNDALIAWKAQEGVIANVEE